MTRKLNGLGMLAIGLALAAATAGAAAAPRASAADAAPLASSEGNAYVVSIADVTTEAGKAGEVLITIRAKEGFKVNEQFPTSVKLDDPPEGLELPKTELKRADGTQVDKQTFTFQVPVKPTRAGNFRLGARVKFSVCTANECLIEKASVEAKVTAK